MAAAVGGLASTGGSLGARVTASSASPIRAVLDGAQPGLTGGPPALTDAREPLAEATRRFASDPEGAIAVLEDVNGRYAPHPQILHALCMLSHKAGRNDQAAEYARTALPLCLDRGALPLAEEILRTLWEVRGTLGLKREHTLQIAAVFFRADELAYAANTFALALEDDRNDARAIKGIMQVAEKYLKGRNQPADAEKLYAYLLHVAPDSPLVEYVLQGLEGARKMAAQTQTG
jgi:tetratricopeptide (TPR) repeat protein